MTEAEVAARWWADALRDAPVASAGDAKLDAFTAALTPTRNPLYPAIVEQFYTALVASIPEKMKTVNCYPWSTGKVPVIIATDYGPDGWLQETLTAADVPRSEWSRLPIKTVMWISPGSVIVRSGYRAAEVTIFPVGEA